MNKKHVLVVDDSTAFVMFMTILLKRMGFDVMSAGNGAEALGLAKLFNPDLITLDMDMPVLSGIETLEKIKQDELLAGIPVIMMSGNSDEALMERCKVLGSSFYLTKPLNLNRLNEALEICLYQQERRVRQYLRADYTEKVKITHCGVEQVYQAQTLSEHGIFVHTAKPLPIGSETMATLSFGEKTIFPMGNVIYIRHPGMAIKFKDLASAESIELKNFISNLLVRDIASLQKENIYARS